MATKTKKTAVKTKKTATKKGSPAKIVPGFPPGHPNYRSTKDRVKANAARKASPSSGSKPSRAFVEKIKRTQSPAKIVPGFPPGHPNYRSTKDRVKANSKKEASARNAHLTSAGRVPARYKKMIKRGK